MKVGRVILVMALLVAMTSAVMAIPKKVYVRTDGTRVRSGASVSDPVVATVDRGAELSVTGSEGGRYVVSLPGGKSGYVPRLRVTTTKPREARKALMSMGTSSIGVSESDSVASLRGLSEAARKMAASGQTTEQAVKWVEQMEANSKKVGKEQVRAFLTKAGVGF